jgi:hypothetical protein
MGILTNPRHELFAQELAKGKSATEAYTLGYKPCRQNAARLMTNDNIRARLDELQGAVARSTKVTVESICRELDEANAVAKAKGQAAAMVSAATLRAKLSGLMFERVEVGNPGDFDGCESTAEIVDRLLERSIEQFKPVDQADREGLIALMERNFKEQKEYVDAINARPIIAERVDPRRLDTPWQQLKPYAPTAPRRIGYKDGNGGASK